MNLNYLEVLIPKKLNGDITFAREMDYFIKYISKINTPTKKVNFGNEEKLIPEKYFDYLNEKINIFKEKYNNIEAAIIYCEE